MCFCSGPEIDSLSHDTGIVFQPLSHVFGIGMIVTHLNWGVTSLLMPQFDLQQFVQLIAEFKVTRRHSIACLCVWRIEFWPVCTLSGDHALIQ